MSLSEQLKQLQIPGQSVIQQIGSKRVSILFDAPTAASLDNEAICNIGKSGFEELVSIDSLFNQFSSFFDKESVRFQRNMITKKENKILKQKISDFLLYLSPYLLLKPTQKILEWLIRRFQIHIFDKDAFIGCILPFHESQIFARIIQLFGTKELGDMWDWLLPCQKEGAGFNTQTLIKHCKDQRNRNLLSFIFKMATNANDALKLNPKSGMKLYFSFYARTVTCVLDSYSTLKEGIVSFLLPQLHAGLQSRSKHFISASYMIVGMICLKTKLSKDVCKAFISTVLKSMQPGWYEEGLLCLMSILAHQKVKVLSSRALKTLLVLDLDTLMSELVSLRYQYELDQLIRAIISCACKHIAENDKVVTLLKQIIDEFDLKDGQIVLLIRELIESLINIMSENEDDIGKFASFMKSIATRYSSQFDSNITFLFDKFNENNDQDSLALLQKLIHVCLSSTKNQLITTSELPLVISINHPEVTIRSSAIHCLFQSYKDSIDTYEESFYRNTILSRFADESPDVITALLKYSKQIVKVLSVNEIIEIVQRLMERTDHYFNVNELLTYIVKNFDMETVSSMNHSFVYVFFRQFLYGLTGKRHKKVVEGLAGVTISSSSPILNGIFNTMKNIDKSLSSKSPQIVVNVFEKLFSNIADEFIRCENGNEKFKHFWSYKNSLPHDHNIHFIGLFLLNVLMTKRTDSLIFQLDLSVSTNLSKGHSNQDSQNILKTFISSEFSSNFIMTEFYQIMKTESSDISVLNHLAYLNLLKNLIQQVSLKKDGSEVLKKEFYAIISSQACDSKSVTKDCFRHLLNDFFVKSFSSKEEILNFLCSICTSSLNYQNSRGGSNIKTTVCALSLISKLFTDNDAKILENDEQALLISTTLALLYGEVQVVRQVAVNTIQRFYSATVSKKNFLWNYFLEKISDAHQEIVHDQTHIKRLFQKVFSLKKSKKNEFESLMRKSKVSKNLEKQQIFTKFYMESVKRNEPILQMHLVTLLEQANVEDVWNELVEVASAILDKNGGYLPEEEKIVISILRHLNEEGLHLADENTVECFVKAMESKLSQLQDCCLEIMKTSFYSELSCTSQFKVLVTLLKMLLSTVSVVEATAIRVVLRSINISAVNMAHFLTSFCSERDQLEVRSNTLNQSSNEELLKSDAFRHMTEILEAVNAKKSFSDLAILLTSLFNVFERLLNLNDAIFEYHCQLCLTTLQNLMENEQFFSIPSDKFKINVLIRCLQSNKDIQTSQLCLNVLSKAAALYPTQVLHSVMHIFTFIGGNMLRIDNAYTYNIIEKTITSIIPVLIKKDSNEKPTKKRSSSQTTNEMVMFILQTFVDSLPHCPEHRRIHILTNMLRVMGVDEYFHLLLLLLLKKLVHKANKQSEGDIEEMEVSPVTLEFCRYLFTGYSVNAQLNCLRKIIVWLNNSVDSQYISGKKRKTAKGFNMILLDMECIAEKYSKILKYTIMNFASDILESEQVVGAYYHLDKNVVNTLTNNILSLLEELLQYTEKLSKLREKDDDQKSAKFASSMLNKSQKLIGALYSLLPFESFVNVIHGLIEKENHLIRKKSLELLSSKLENIKSIPEDQEKIMLELLKKLIQLVQYKEGDSEPPFNKQLMLLIIKHLAVFLCVTHKEEFCNGIPIIVQLFSVTDGNLLVAMSAILCIAEFSLYLKSDMLPYLPILMKPLIEKVSSEENLLQNKNQELLLTSFMVAIESFLTSIPQFLSPYIPDILSKVSLCNTMKDTNSGLSEKLEEVMESFGKCLPPRVLYPALEAGVEKCLTENAKQVPTYLHILKHSFTFISKQDANANFNKNLQAITKKALNARSVVGNIEIVRHIEDVAIEAFCKLVLKLSENTLRPFYLGLFTWATSDEEKHVRRILSFYRLSVRLSAELKSLYLLFVAHILKHATEVLTNCTGKNDQDRRNEVDFILQKETVTAVIDTVTNVFYYDHQGFIDKEKFESMMKPILDQLENELFAGDYENFVKKHLCNCIVSFAAAVNDASCWKALNHHLLLKTKHANVKVRLASLQVTQEIYSRLGESYMILVPETIPFLAEVLEDDTVEVENMGHKVIKQIEGITGESLQKYF